MHIVVNGEDYDAPEECTVLGLLERLALSRRRVAVLKDDEVVRKADFAGIRLEADACIEIVQMVGGG